MPVPATGINAANGALPAPAPPPPCPVPLPATNPVATPPCAVVVPVGLPPAQQASPTIPTTHSTMCLAPEDKKLKEPAPLKSSLPTKPDNLLEN